MKTNGLIISYKGGVNSVYKETYPVGELLCLIFQGDTLVTIRDRLRNCIECYPMQDEPLSQNAIEELEHYVQTSLRYDDFYPAQELALGTFVRFAEHYRALDSASQARLLQEEQGRAITCPDLAKPVGFDNAGNFLRLCLNNYIIDLDNALRLFNGMAAALSGSAGVAEESDFCDICSQLNTPGIVPSVQHFIQYDAMTGTFGEVDIINSFLSLVVYEFSHMATSKVKIRRCENPECRRFFTAKRSSAKYCKSTAPQNSRFTCDHYYPQLVNRQKKKMDRAKHLMENASSRLYMDKKRHPEHANEIGKLLQDLQINGPAKLESIANKEMSIEGFTTWLNDHKRKKGDQYE